MNDHHERELLNRVRVTLDACLDTIDPAQLKRLREGRQQALQLAGKRPISWFSLPRLIPVGGIAALTVVALSVSLWFGMRPQPFSNSAAEEVDMLTVPDNLELYKDMDFYQWLAQTHAAR